MNALPRQPVQPPLRQPRAARRLAIALTIGAVLGAVLGASPMARAQTTAPEEPDEEVVVTSSRIEIPLREIGTAVAVITADEIRLRGYDSVADVLRSQPAIGVTNSGGIGRSTSVRVRGEEHYRTLVMIDGVEFSDPTATQVGPIFDHLMTTSDLERVEILRGAHGFMYGADAGGVVNILTRTGQGALNAGIRLEGGAFGTRRVDANVSGGTERGDFFVSAAESAMDGFNSNEADSVLRDDDGYDNTTLHAKLGVNVGERVRVQLVARDIDARFDFDMCGFPAVHDCVGETQQTTARLSSDYVTDRGTHSFGVGRTQVDRQNFAAGVNAFATQGEVMRLDYTGALAPAESYTLVYGLDLEREDVRASGAPARRDQKAAYFEYQGRFADRVFLKAGARHDDNDDFGRHTSLRTTLAYVDDRTNGSTVKYRAGFGTGFRAPSLSEIAYNEGPFAFPPAQGVALNEETSRGYDVGIEWTGRRGQHVEVTYFDQRIEDEIFFDLATFSGYLQSLGTSRSRGVELLAEIRLGARWAFMGNLTFNDTDDTAGEQRIRRPERFGNLGARYLSASEKFRMFASYRLSADAVDEVFGIGRIPLPDHEILDLSFAYSVNDHVDLHARLENATDESYFEAVGFRTGGSAAYAGVRLTF